MFYLPIFKIMIQCSSNFQRWPVNFFWLIFPFVFLVFDSVYCSHDMFLWIIFGWWEPFRWAPIFFSHYLSSFFRAPKCVIPSMFLRQDHFSQRFQFLLVGTAFSITLYSRDLHCHWSSLFLGVLRVQNRDRKFLLFKKKS